MEQQLGQRLGCRCLMLLVRSQGSAGRRGPGLWRRRRRGWPYRLRQPEAPVEHAGAGEGRSRGRGSGAVECEGEEGRAMRALDHASGEEGAVVMLTQSPILERAIPLQ